MSAPVDVLAVNSRAINCAEAYIAELECKRGNAKHINDARAHLAELREARTAVAELIEVAEVANSVAVGLELGQPNHHHIAELRRLLKRPAVVAALARVGGDQ